MSETLITAIFTFAGIITSGLVSIITSASLINWRLKTIEAKLESHNGYAEKFAQSATDMALMKQDIKYIKEKLSAMG